MTVTKTDLPGVLILEPTVFRDDRGFFLETFQESRYAEWGISGPFVQHNHSRSVRNVLRGLHFQRRHPQGKLVRVSTGRALDVIADVRPGSPTFGKHIAIELDGESHRQIWIPPGFAHGFLALSDQVDFLYAVTTPYQPDDEGGIRWDDPDLAIDWPIESPILSPRDAELPFLRDLSSDDLPRG